MEVNQTYYWVVDFTNTIYKGASNHTWEVYFDSTLEIEYSLKEAVGDGWWWYDNGDGVITLHYDNSTDGKTQTLRLIFEVTPVQKGKGTATLCFDGDITFAAWNEYLGDYGDYDYDNESISPASRKITVR